MRCQRSDREEFRRYLDGDSDRADREHLVFAMQEEKIDLLKLMFTLFYRDDADLSKKDDLVSDMVDYLLQSCHVDQVTAH